MTSPHPTARTRPSTASGPRRGVAALAALTLATSLAACSDSTPAAQTSSAPAAPGTVASAGTGATTATHAACSDATVCAGTASATSASAGPAQPSPSPAIPTSGPVDPILPRTGTGALDVQRYDLTLDYGMATTGVLTGTARLTLTARTDLPTITLDLRGYTVSKATVDGKPAKVQAQKARLGIVPSAPLKAGQDAVVEVTYSGRPPQYVDESGAECGFVVRRGGVAAVNEPNCASTWFPSNDAPWDKAVFTIATTVPEGWTVAGNGRLKDEKHAGGKATFTWDSVDPMAPYLATASIGRFQLRKGTTPSGVEIIDAVDPALPASATSVLAQTGSLLSFLEGKFGAYPLVNTGSIMSSADIDYELETQTRIYLGKTTDPSTLLHELCHQWWGNSVTPRSWADVWINEGSCTYAEWEWGAANGGPSVAAKKAQVMAKPASAPFWATKVSSPGAAGLFSAPVYTRSAAFFATLQETLGQEEFDELRRRWVTEHKNGTGSTEQLQALAGELAGKDLTPLFDAWVRSGTKPRA